MDERADDRTIGHALDDQTGEERGEQMVKEQTHIHAHIKKPSTSVGRKGEAGGAFTFETE